MYPYLNYSSLMEEWTQRQTDRKRERKKSTGKTRRQQRHCHTAGWWSDRDDALGMLHFLL